MAEKYRNYTIRYNPPPIPVRSCDWSWVHDDDEGEETGRHGFSASLEEAKADIDANIEERESEMTYHAEQFINVVGSECDTKIEIRIAVEYSMLDGRPEFIFIKILDDDGRRFALPALIKYTLLKSDDFINWLVFEANEIELEKRA